MPKIIQEGGERLAKRGMLGQAAPGARIRGRVSQGRASIRVLGGGDGDLIEPIALLGALYCPATCHQRSRERLSLVRRTYLFQRLREVVGPDATQISKLKTIAKGPRLFMRLLEARQECFPGKCGQRLMNLCPGLCAQALHVTLKRATDTRNDTEQAQPGPNATQPCPATQGM